MLTHVGNRTERFPEERVVDDVQDRESMVIQYGKDENTDDEIDSGEVNSKSGSDTSGLEDFTRVGLVGVEEGSTEYNALSRSFLKSIGTDAKDTKLLGIHKNMPENLMMKARKETFKIFEQAVAEKSGGDANIWLGWYGGSKEELCRIVMYGFNSSSVTGNAETRGVGIHLASAKFPFASLSSMRSVVLDSNGVSHMLLCRAIMGKMEPIPIGSNQNQPSSTEFDSGVDSPTAPRRLTVWSAFMNSHILPAYIISFKPPSVTGRNQVRLLRPSSPWMSFPRLMDILSKRLDPSKMASIQKTYDDFRNGKIPRQTMIQRLRQLSGDNLLVEIIKSCKSKVLSNRQLKPFLLKKVAT
ncbi:hypothetical protein M5689_019505 [Euphorbia peplus]|nr:hypothetical protein M5689_019505 [Euphorbia peplus]